MHLVTSLLLLLGGSTSLVKAWLPTDQGRSLSAFTNGNTTKIRGVNLGSHFIVEPWMAYSEWVNTMGCKDSSGNQYRSEWDCVQGLGQDAANEVFKKHWQTWITEEDISTMAEYGLNTIYIAVVRPTELEPCLTLSIAYYIDPGWILDEGGPGGR